jgi:general secretion pathway protein I
MPNETRRKPGCEAGFTLIEVMVALLIAGLAMLVLLRAGFTGAASTKTAVAYEEALERAESRLASVGPLTPVQAGQFSGDDGGGFTWRLAITKLQTEGQLALYDVTVTEIFGGRRVILQTERLAPPS